MVELQLLSQNFYVHSIKPLAVFGVFGIIVSKSERMLIVWDESLRSILSRLDLFDTLVLRAINGRSQKSPRFEMLPNEVTHNIQRKNSLWLRLYLAGNQVNRVAEQPNNCLNIYERYCIQWSQQSQTWRMHEMIIDFCKWPEYIWYGLTNGIDTENTRLQGTE
jgi:hypothetical protein